MKEKQTKKNDEIASIGDKIWNIKNDYFKEILISYFRIVANKYLIISSAYICLIILILYFLCMCIFQKIFGDNFYLNNNCVDK